MPIRARDLNLPFRGQPGVHNAITDVDGVLVGQTTLIAGDGRLVVGEGPIRTGVTLILPRGYDETPVFAAWYSLNGNGEMTGTTWIEESGLLEGPIGLTNTHSVGTVRDAIIAWQIAHNPDKQQNYWSLPVVAETYDGILNDINGFHVKPDHVFAAFDTATGGAVDEGAVGGGTGMICHEFKGGIGTSSRIVPTAHGDYTLGILVQANYGRRDHLTLAGVPVGQHLKDEPPLNIVSSLPPGSGSIIIVLATDAPLLPHQLKRLTRRIPMGLAHLGGIAGHTSGDIFVAFSTANPEADRADGVATIAMLPNSAMNPLFEATIDATEEAIVNALVAAKPMVGINGCSVPALPHERVRDILRQYGRLTE